MVAIPSIEHYIHEVNGRPENFNIKKTIYVSCVDEACVRYLQSKSSSCGGLVMQHSDTLLSKVFGEGFLANVLKGF